MLSTCASSSRLQWSGGSSGEGGEERPETSEGGFAADSSVSVSVMLQDITPVDYRPRSCRAHVRTRSPHQSGDAASEYADCCRVSPGRHEVSPRPPCSGPLLQHRRRSAALGPAAAPDTLDDWRSDRGGLVACGSVMVGVLASPGPYKAVGRNVVYQVLQ